MNNKGITLITVIVMIIVMLIIATVSLVAGNEIIVNSNEYRREQELESVKEAVLRRKSEVEMSGTIIPIGEAYVGTKNPIICTDERGTLVANDWYLLDKESLENIGVYDTENKYVVNYDYGIVLSTYDESYIEEYMVIKCLYDYISRNSTLGTALENKTGSDTSKKMYVNNDNGDLFGTGWYFVSKADLPSIYSAYIENSYLLNFKNAEYVKVTSTFKEV